MASVFPPFRLAAAAAMLVFAGTVIASAREHRIELSPEARDGRLVITGLSGDIAIVGGDESTLVAIDEDDESDESDKNENGVERADSRRSNGAASRRGASLRIEVSGSTVTVASTRPHRSGDFVFRVPRGMSVQLPTILNADVTVKELRGEIEATINHGDLVLDAVSGPVIVQAVNADVNVVFAQFSARRPSSITATNGDVEIVLPRDAAATLDLRTVNGDIHTSAPIEVRERRVPPHGGPSSLRATLNGGGVELTVTSINDDIDVRVAK